VYLIFFANYDSCMTMSFQDRSNSRMPLILMVGYPSSGKSTIVDALVEYIRSNRPDTKIVIVRDNDLTTFDREIYRESSKEKEHRGYLRSSIQKSLTDETLVIVDSLNYIKGYRYELHCVAKQSKTTYCVVFCDVSPDTARSFNSSKEDAKGKYAPDILDALIQRFEPPDSRHRWDSPLFTLHPSVDEKRVPDLESTLKEVVECIFEGARLKSNQSTQAQPLSSTNFLYELDTLTQTIVRSLMDSQKGAVPGDQLGVPGTDQKVIMKNTRSLGELTRLRRQFIAYTKMHPVDDRSKLAAMFVTFINNS
jgi:protein KTI12